MYIIEIIPLTNLPISQPQILSYFSSYNLASGSLVKISLKKRLLPGIVVRSHSLKEKKAEIKKSSFYLKPVTRVLTPKAVVPPYFFSLATFLSHYYFTSLSLACKTMLPPRIAILAKYIQSSAIDIDRYNPSQVVLKGIKRWSTIEENFQKTLQQKKQALLLVPTTSYQKYYFNLLQQKFPRYIYNFQRNLPLKQIAYLWNNLLSGKPSLIIGCRSAIFLPWTTLKQIVVVEPNHPSYKSWEQKPYYEATILAQKIANLLYASLTYYQNY